MDIEIPVAIFNTIDKPEIEPMINLLGTKKKCTAAAVINIPIVRIGSSFKNDFAFMIFSPLFTSYS